MFSWLLLLLEESGVRWGKATRRHATMARVDEIRSHHFKILVDDDLKC